MAAPSTAFTYSPPALSPHFPADVTSTPPQSGPDELEPARERRTSQKRTSATTGYPSPTPTATTNRYAPFAPPALSPGPPRVVPPAATTRPFFAYDPSLVIPPFNPNKRRGANPPPDSSSAPAAAATTTDPRRASAQAAALTAPPAPTHFSAQQQQHYQQQWAQLVQHQQQQQLALAHAQIADRARQAGQGPVAPAPAPGRAAYPQPHQQHAQQQQQQQRPVSVMPAMPGRAPAQHPSAAAAHDAALYHPGASYYPSGAAPSGPGGSVSSRVRQSVGYLPVGAPSSHSGGAAPPSSAPGTPGSGGPYPHLYTPHPMPRQKVYFGPYVLLQTLGEGEFGKVKLGVHGERWGEDVAIKLIKRGNVDTAQRGEKVRREIEVLKMVRHPNIVRLYDVIETEKYIGIVLEYASGGELFDHILAHRYLKERDASRLFAQLVSGVSYLHAKGVVHRDLKLENLLLDRNRNVIITDFGFANRFNDARADLMATSCGSPCYAAPELVVSDGKYVGTAVDVWSCGVILYAMLAGYLPYDDDPLNPDGDNINLLYRYILSTPLTFPDWITDEPRGLLLDMLVADPLKRCTITDVTRHSWLRRYAPAFDKSVDELEYQAQEMERHKRQALEVQRQWLVAQQQQQQLAAQGLLAPSMTRSQTATSGMAGPLAAPLPVPLAASLGAGGPVAQRASGATPGMLDQVQRRTDRTTMVPSASTSAVSTAGSSVASAPLLQGGFEHYSVAQPVPHVAAPAEQQQQAPHSPLTNPGIPLSPGPAPASPPVGTNTNSVTPTAPALVPLVVPEPPISPRTRTTSTGIVPVPHPSNPNRRSGAYTVSSSPPTTQTEFASAEAGPFSFAAVAGTPTPGAASVPMATSLSAPAAPSRSSSGGALGDSNGGLETLNEDSLMRDRTPTGSAASSRRPSTSAEEDEAAAAQRRRKAAYRATLQVEYDGSAAATTMPAPRRRGASREPGLATAVEGLGIDAAPSLPPLPPAVPLSLVDKDQLEVPGGAGNGRGAPSPTPSDGGISVSTTTETHQGEDVVMQSVEEEEQTVTLPAAVKDAPLPPLVLPFPAPTAPEADTPAPPPRKRKSSGSPATSIHPAEIPLPPPPATATPTSESPDPTAPLRTHPKTSTSSQTSQPARPPSASSNASRHRHTASADRFSLRSLLGASNPPQPTSSSSTSRPPVLAPAVPPVPPLPAKDTPLDEVTNRRKSTRRQKAMSLQPFRHSVSSKLPKGARANVDSAAAAAASVGAGAGSSSGAAAGRERASTVHAQGETIQPGQAAAVPAVPPKQASRPPSSSRTTASGSLASHKRFSADLEANWGHSASSSSPSGTAGSAPGGKAKAVMDWFRRKSSRNEGHAQVPAPIKVDFDRSPVPTPTSAATAGPAFAPRRSTSAAKPDAPALSPASSAAVAAQAPQDPAGNPSVVVTQPLPAPPQAEQPQQQQQHDSAPASQISDRRASTLNSSVGSSIGGASAQQQQQPVIFASPPAFAPTKLRFHQGALDKNAVTYRAPTDVLADIKQVLWSMGVDMSMEGDYKIKCVRKSRKKALASSVGPSAGGPSASNGFAPNAALPSSTAQDRRGSLVSTTSLTQSPSMGFRSLFGKKQVGGSTTPSSPNFSVPGTPSAQDQHSVDPLSSPMTTSVSQFSMLSLSSPQPLPVYGGDKSADAGDEVRFVVELTRVKNLDRLYCVDMKRMKGMAWSYKHVYDQLLASLELGPSI
ncbi:hypothetical protein JCM9279_003415 [Rhodotorula babjevae]